MKSHEVLKAAVEGVGAATEQRDSLPRPGHFSAAFTMAAALADT